MLQEAPLYNLSVSPHSLMKGNIPAAIPTPFASFPKYCVGQNVHLVLSLETVILETENGGLSMRSEGVGGARVH